MIVSGKSYAQLKQYLISHESDISWDVNDFGELYGLFCDVFERKPAK